MISRNLLTDPCWSYQDLGNPLPDSPHAVSVALPRWQDVIAYEEQDPACINSLRAIYPRFGFNPIIAEIAKIALTKANIHGGTSWPYPNLTIAEEAREYCEKTNSNGHTSIINVAGIECLVVDNTTTTAAKSFWQHTGQGASSRQAAIALKREKSPSRIDGELAKKLLRKRLGNIYQCPTKYISLYPSGMAALTAALKVIHGQRSIIQLGFPYVDVLKLPQKIFNGSDLILTQNLSLIKKELDEKKPSALIIELPSNPMLQCIDLPEVSKLARTRHIPIIADDTIGSGVNINSLPYADLIFSSLTKSFAGSGDILAGGLVISPESPWANDFYTSLTKIGFTSLSDPDAIALERASKDVEKRLPKLNNACQHLKEKLERHPDILRVLHPSNCNNFKKIMRPQGGYGCLLSFEFKEGLPKAKRFYDALKVCKGPSLGTNFTLVCPYVLLAHYNELKWAEECGVPSHLIRVSVGLEEPNILWNRFAKALNK